MVSGVKKTSRVSSARPSVYLVTAWACPIERTKSTWPVSVSTAPSPYGADSTKSAPPCSKFWCSSSARTSASARVILSPGLRSAAELSEQPASSASTSPRASSSEQGRDGMAARVGGKAEGPGPPRWSGPLSVASALEVAPDERLDGVAGLAVGVLHRRALHEVGRRRQQRGPHAAVLGDLCRGDRIDDDPGRVGGVPDLVFVLQVQRHVAER